MTGEDRDALIQKLDYLVSSVGKHFTNVRRAFRDFDVTGPEYFLLRLLSVEGTRHVSDVAAHLCLTQAAASNVINAAEEKGLVTKTKDPGDRRITRISLTEAGEKLLAEVKKGRLERNRWILRQLCDDDLEELIRIFTKLKTDLVRAESDDHRD
ncbi:MAG: MarR family winged helix-turn-helix transcriptional regulator [Bacillota bacterium]